MLGVFPFSIEKRGWISEKNLARGSDVRLGGVSSAVPKLASRFHTPVTASPPTIAEVLVHFSRTPPQAVDKRRLPIVACF